jgi:transposase
VDIEREKDVEQLRRIARTQKVQIEQLAETLRVKCRELESLKGDDHELQRTLDILNQRTKQALEQARATPGATCAEEEPNAGSAKHGNGRRPRSQFGNTPQPKLEHEQRVFELDEADKSCPQCGGGLEPMEGVFEESEMVDVVEVSYKVVQVKQQKYRCRCGGCVETALGPRRATAGSRYSLGFALQVMIRKYLDHLPLERQVRILRRFGLKVTSQTLWQLLDALERKLQRTYRALFDHVMAEPVIGLDQTGWKRLSSKKSKPWQMWCLTAPGVVYHSIRDDKATKTFVELVGDFEGVIVCDDLKTHGAGAREGPGIVLAGCWAHVTRRFQEAVEDHPDAQYAVDKIGELYAIDAEAEGDLGKLAQLRQQRSRAVLDELKQWLWAQASLKTLSIGKAARYAVNTWERLTRFVEDPRIPLDNNATERGIRGPVVGRRNHFGSKSQRGTQVAAVMYTLLETAKLHDVDPAEYLAAVVDADERGLALFPWQMAEAPAR